MKKRCAITGHTKGLAVKLWEYFESQGYECIGFTRREGYDISISEQRKEIVRLAEGVDVFINNACNKDDSQVKLTVDMHRKCKRMIICGSISSSYPDIFGNDNYVNSKVVLSECVKHLQTINDSNVARMLYLDLCHMSHSFVNPDNPKDFDCDYAISRDDVVKVVDFWMNNPMITKVEWNTQWTPYLESELERCYPDTYKPALDKIEEKVKYFLHYNDNEN